MNAEQLGGLVRAVMATLGGSALTYGGITSEQWLAITGGVVTLVTLVWTWYVHKDDKKPVK